MGQTLSSNSCPMRFQNFLSLARSMGQHRQAVTKGGLIPFYSVSVEFFSTLLSFHLQPVLLFMEKSDELRTEGYIEQEIRSDVTRMHPKELEMEQTRRYFTR
ncbi:hypothetical protein NPIL_155941 [Nephila pilipes]|uniref:Uncharacterized protein n=1 Tax=Nephila pilipes TaxID=299642 RepID=A0A8X6MQE7_NEPPI|nr:hypothetical protein NPIL_155941 [Nephila pilipes]